MTRQTSLPEAHYHLGEGWLKKNDPKKALAELKVASDTVSRANATAGIAASPGCLSPYNRKRAPNE